MPIALDPTDAHHLMVLAAHGLTEGESLVVSEGSTAVLMEHGRPRRILPPGRYTVPADFAGLDVEVFFVDTRSRRGLRFGGRVGPIAVPEGTLSSVFGELGFRVQSPERLVVGMAAMGPGVHSDEVLAWIKAKVLRALDAALAAERGADPAERVDAAVARVFTHTEALEEMGIALEELRGVTAS